MNSYILEIISIIKESDGEVCYEDVLDFFPYTELIVEREKFNSDLKLLVDKGYIVFNTDELKYSITEKFNEVFETMFGVKL